MPFRDIFLVLQSVTSKKSFGHGKRYILMFSELFVKYRMMTLEWIRLTDFYPLILWYHGFYR